MTTHEDNWTLKTKKNTLYLGIWTAAWTLSMALSTFGPRLIWDADPTLTIIAIMFTLAMGGGMIWANKRYLDGLDELQKKIQLEAFAIALGVGVVGGLSYAQLVTSKLINGPADISHLVILMSLTYLSAFVLGQIRYK